HSVARCARLPLGVPIARRPSPLSASTGSCDDCPRLPAAAIDPRQRLEGSQQIADNRLRFACFLRFLQKAPDSQAQVSLGYTRHPHSTPDEFGYLAVTRIMHQPLEQLERTLDRQGMVHEDQSGI